MRLSLYGVRRRRCDLPPGRKADSARESGAGISASHRNPDEGVKGPSEGRVVRPWLPGELCGQQGSGIYGSLPFRCGWHVHQLRISAGKRPSGRGLLVLAWRRGTQSSGDSGSAYGAEYPQLHGGEPGRSKVSVADQGCGGCDHPYGLPPFRPGKQQLRSGTGRGV